MQHADAEHPSEVTSAAFREVKPTVAKVSCAEAALLSLNLMLDFIAHAKNVSHRDIDSGRNIDEQACRKKRGVLCRPAR